MLTALRNRDRKKVVARSSVKGEAPFSCPECMREVVLHKGNIRVHHFAHKPPVTCRLGTGETEAHLKTKLAIFDALSTEQNVQNLELERNFGVSVADVFAQIGGTSVAIEIQRSTLSVADITRRTANYHALGITVLWLALPNESIFSKKYSPSAWEKWVHAAYFGRVYYWLHGQTVQPVHFGPFHIEVEYKTWYESGGEMQSAGGYTRTAKRYKTPQPGQQVQLARDFRSANKEAWAGGTVTVPACRLYVDRQTKWWS